MSATNSHAGKGSQPIVVGGHRSRPSTGNGDSARQRAQSTPYAPDHDRPPVRRPASEREGSFSAVGWLLDGASGLIGEIRHNDLGLSEEFWVHAYAARREGVLAVQALLNDILAHTTSGDEKAVSRQARRDRRGSVEIDF